MSFKSIPIIVRAPVNVVYLSLKDMRYIDLLPDIWRNTSVTVSRDILDKEIEHTSKSGTFEIRENFSLEPHEDGTLVNYTVEIVKPLNIDEQQSRPIIQSATLETVKSLLMLEMGYNKGMLEGVEPVQRCYYCSREESNPYTCVTCGKQYCSEHKSPNVHGCTARQAAQDEMPQVEESEEQVTFSKPLLAEAYFTPYQFGRAGEYYVAEVMQKRGWIVHLHAGSRGAMDLEAFKNSKRWYVQVKRTARNVERLNFQGQQIPFLRNLLISNKELGRLRRVATNHSATPILACLFSDALFFLSARDFRIMSP